MASTTHAAALYSAGRTRVQARQEGASGAESSGSVDADGSSGWPDASQVWTWTAEAIASGYGPPSTHFCRDSAFSG